MSLPKPENFNGDVESFQNYKERLDSYFIANDVPNEKKVPILLSVIGSKTYGTLKSLSAPALPSTLAYNRICTLLNEHYNPRPLEIMERFRFHARSQVESESVSEFVAALKNLTIHCNFGQYLQQALRDRLVCGLRCESTQKRLLEEDPLTFERAIQIATSMETAKKDMAQMRSPDNGTTADIHRLRARRNEKSTVRKRKEYSPCISCGWRNHPSSICVYRNSTCFSCHEKGHIRSNCRKNKNEGSFHELRKSGEKSPPPDDEHLYELFTLSGEDKMLVDVGINNVQVKMEFDTGSAFALMTLRDYRMIFKENPVLEKTTVKVKTYTNEVVVPLGKVVASVVHKNKEKRLPLLILKEGDNPILGRNWMFELNLLQEILNIKDIIIEKKPKKGKKKRTSKAKQNNSPVEKTTQKNDTLMEEKVKEVTNSTQTPTFETLKLTLEHLETKDNFFAKWQEEFSNMEKVLKDVECTLGQSARLWEKAKSLR